MVKAEVPIDGLLAADDAQAISLLPELPAALTRKLFSWLHRGEE